MRLFTIQMFTCVSICPLQFSMTALFQGAQRGMAELVGEFLLHLEDFSRSGIVPKCTRHLLVGHGPPIAFPLPPESCHLVFIPGGEAEHPIGCCGRHPGNTVGHARILQHLKQEVKQTHLSTCK